MFITVLGQITFSTKIKNKYTYSVSDCSSLKPDMHCHINIMNKSLLCSPTAGGHSRALFLSKRCAILAVKPFKHTNGAGHGFKSTRPCSSCVSSPY